MPKVVEPQLINLSVRLVDEIEGPPVFQSPQTVRALFWFDSRGVEKSRGLEYSERLDAIASASNEAAKA